MAIKLLRLTTVGCTMLLGIAAGGCQNTSGTAIEKPMSQQPVKKSAPVLQPAQAPTSAPNAPSASRYPVKRTLSTGEIGLLWLGNNDEVVVAVDEDSLKRFQQLSIAKDMDGVVQMALNGRLFSVAAGTRCRMIDGGIFTSEIRVTEGTQQGRSGFVPTEWIYGEAGAPGN